MHGNPLDLTPNFDRLARAGTDVHYSFTPYPVCGPCRNCLQTGTYASTNGGYKNGIPLNRDLPNLATAFRNAGYHTGYLGKWHLAPPNEEEGDAPVNDESYHVPEAWRGGYEWWLGSNALEHTSDAFDFVVYDNDNQPVKRPGYRVDAQTDAMIEFIDKQKGSDRPFFLFNSYLEPHHQNHVDAYPAPPGYEQKYTDRWCPPDLAALPAWPYSGHDRPLERRLDGGTAHQHLGGYLGMVKRLDEALGRLVDALISSANSTTRSSCSPPITATTSRPETPSTSAPATKRASVCRRCCTAGRSPAAGGCGSW